MHFVVAAVFFLYTTLSIRTVTIKQLQLNAYLAASMAPPTIQMSEGKAS
jgi:hypothetical protein